MLFVFFLFGDDGFEFDRREGPTIGERAPVTCYQGLKSSSSSFRVKFLLSSTRFCAFWMCVLARGRVRERHRRILVWVDKVRFGAFSMWMLVGQRDKILFVAMIVVCWMEVRNNGARAVVSP